MNDTSFSVDQHKTATHACLRYPVILRDQEAAGVMRNVGLVDPDSILYGKLGASAARPGAPLITKLYAMVAEAECEATASSLILPPKPLWSMNATPTIFAADKSARSRTNAPLSGSKREELLKEAAKLKFFVIVLEQKGGVGKSVVSVTAEETLKLLYENILLIDADFINKNLSRAGLTKAGDALNASRIDFEGFLYEAAERLVSGEVEGVVIDSAAGGEQFFHPHLAELARMLRDSDAGARLVILRPLTLSPLVHDNIVQFGKIMTSDMGVLMVRNMGQGRSFDDFEDFDGSPDYATMRQLGMKECILESAGAKYSDLVTSFGRTFAQIALHEPDELGLSGRPLEIARRVFTRPVRLFLARWLLRQTTNIQTGLFESILHTL